MQVLLHAQLLHVMYPCLKWDNTNWRAGQAGGPCFHMVKVDFRRAAAHKTEGRAGGLHKKAVRRAAEKGRPPARPFPQLSLMCSPLARPSGSLPARGKFMFFIWQHSPSARPDRWPSV